MLGGHRIIGDVGSVYQVDLDSIYDTSLYELCDGHVNRNIRAILAMADLSKPQIIV